MLQGVWPTPKWCPVRYYSGRMSDTILEECYSPDALCLELKERLGRGTDVFGRGTSRSWRGERACRLSKLVPIAMYNSTSRPGRRGGNGTSLDGRQGLIGLHKQLSPLPDASFPLPVAFEIWINGTVAVAPFRVELQADGRTLRSMYSFARGEVCRLERPELLSGSSAGPIPALAGVWSPSPAVLPAKHPAPRLLLKTLVKVLVGVEKHGHIFPGLSAFGPATC